MNLLSNVTRPAGDPKVIKTGPSSLPLADRAGRLLGWFSLALGITELVRPASITGALGMQGREGWVRAYGVREIASGVMCLSVTRSAGLWGRVAGDAMDIATVLAADRPNNPERDSVRTALSLLALVAVVDLATAAAVTRTHARPSRIGRDYGGRSGFPKGIEQSRGIAAPSRTPQRAPAAETFA